MSDNKLSSRPPSMGGAQSSLDEFIGGAGVHTPEPPRPVPAPQVEQPTAIDGRGAEFPG